jgi:hypothetical protein
VNEHRRPATEPNVSRELPELLPRFLGAATRTPDLTDD